MSAFPETLPEGTDTIIDGAGVSSDDDTFDRSPAPAGETQSGGDTGPGGNASTAESAGVRDQLFGRVDALKGEAGDRARDFVQAGKDRATSALDDVVRMIEDAASEVDDKLGSQYGDYARRAAQGIAGFSDAFKDKDVDDLFADARALIAKSPAAAAGIAAALGFAVARLARSGIGETAPGKDAPKA
jgi:hypothetical protein